ncbi:gamma-glutamyltransferase family protein [Paenibacillus thalictri]|uniref:Gamma-glutamyltransferase family protein n=1 Tax=Paenibacillus thalictri TaxID=2527873 RepID=A0A4Q9DN28_9BACL|nr:gamma-glutamyltransferase family protein [Paenibacillus thalictri]TBL77348.1 gamma-glutamyltransferase family protein [Paenibacillus thalictri]
MNYLSFDPLYNPYGSFQMPVYGKKGMVATSHPLAAQAGLDILKRGGNAVDAAIGAAASLTVLEPNSTSIGGDAFALVWHGGRLYGLNASGPAPKGMSIDALRQAGYSKIPEWGVLPVTVPGTPAAWQALSEKFGRLPLTESLEPAIRYAEEGFPLSPVIGYNWKLWVERIAAKLEGQEPFDAFFETFAPGGRIPEAGMLWKSPDHARTLQLIAQTKAEAFYRGELAEQIGAFMKRYDGFLSQEDLASYAPEWVEPISVNYRGFDVWEIPPNGQGLVALMALNLVKGFDFAEKDCVETCHKQIEAMKLSFEEGFRYITDSRKMKVPVQQLLSEEHANNRRQLITDRIYNPDLSSLPNGGTVYLAAADGEGNMVSFIQSNYKAFGSAIVIPGTGINLQNRGMDFSMNPNHDNALEPGKKTYHTIIPGFLTKGGQPVGPFGVMGGYMQPQGHLQILMNTIDFRMNPQAALDAPRWQWRENNTLELEPSFPNHIAEALARKGHHVVRATNSYGFGRGQIIWRDAETGVYAGASESRADGQVAAW